MQQVSVSDAKNRLSALLDQVERGEVVAKPVPAASADQPRVAVERLRALRRTIAARDAAFTWGELKRYRNESRR